MTCHFCGRARLVDPIPPGSFTVAGVSVEACFECWAAHDDADHALTLSMLGARPFAPEEIVPALWPAGRQRPVRDLQGRRFGRLVVIAPTTVPHPDGNPRAAWRVRCDCGREFVMRAYSLTRGASQCRPCAVASLRPRTKLTRAKVDEMRRLRAAGWSLSRLAARAGVSKMAAQKVVRHETWRTAA